MSRIVRAGVSALALMGDAASSAAPQTAAPVAPATPVARTASPRPPLAVEAFAELPDVESPDLSPDGTKVAGRVAINGQQYFAVVKLGGEGPPRLINPGEADLNWWNWVNDEWVIVGIGQELPVEGDHWYVKRAIGVHVPTGKVTQLAPRHVGQNGDDVIWAARDGSARVLLSYQTSIYTNEAGFWPQVDEIDLVTGKRRMVVGSKPGVFNWYADGAGLVRMGIGMSEDGRSRRVLYRDRADASFRTIDRTKTREDRLTVPALFLNDKTRALVIDDDEGGYSALYELNLTTLERGKQLFASKGYDIGGIVPDSTGFGYLGVSVEENHPLIRWTDAEMAAM